MSGGGGHLNDEVMLDEILESVLADTLRQGSRSQVVAAGGVAGLVSR